MSCGLFILAFFSSGQPDNIWSAVSDRISMACRTALSGNAKLTGRQWTELMDGFAEVACKIRG